MNRREIPDPFLLILFLVLALFLMFASAVTVKQDQTQLRGGCEAQNRVIATIRAGSSAQIRFAMTGERETCYKVLVTAGSEVLEGYLPASALEGVDAFRKTVESAPAVSMTAAAPPAPPASGNTSPRRDYQALVAAGIAAYRSDEISAALEYLKEAEQLRADRSVQLLIAKIEKERAGDKSREKLYGTRFLLRYEGGQLAPEVARSVIALLEQEFSRIAAEVGCRTDDRIVTVVQSRLAYRNSTDAAEWSGGLFDGVKIRVPVIETAAIDAQTRRVLSHELVHACLASMGSWPTWLHEGMAQKLSGDTLAPARFAELKSLIRGGKLPRLDNMNQSWSRMSAGHAALAYDYALAAVDLLYDGYRNYGIQNIFRNPDRLRQITASLDKRFAE